MENDAVERRKFKRYSYKPDLCPFLKCKTIRYKVLNISEGGLKIDIQGIPVLLSNSQSDITGYLCLLNGKQIPVSGQLVWIIGNEVGIKLNTPISKKIIDSETDNFQDTI
jgi:hypothetical protein